MGKQLFLDCDGVLADFDRGFFKHFKMKPEVYEERYGTEEFWWSIRNTVDNFFGTLEPMPGAGELIRATSHLRPIILTGCPRGGWSEVQKSLWARKHCPGIPLVTCLAADKALYCHPDDVLVDDREKYRHLWEAAGGVFVHHQTTKVTLKQLFGE